MRMSKILKKLRNNEWVLITTTAILSASSKITELVGSMGFDGLWLDMEHTCYNYDQMFHLIQGARAVDTDCVVRIRKDGYTDYCRLLEDGAAGIMVPHCKSAEEARSIVRKSKFHPQGLRGIDGAGVDADYALADFSEYIRHARNETFVSVMIEDKEAVECIDEIAAVEGIDILFMGCFDLSQSYGITGEVSNYLIDEAIQKVSRASKKYSKWWGIQVNTVKEAEKYLNMGAKFICSGDDVLVLIEGYKKIIKDFQSLKTAKK